MYIQIPKENIIIALSDTFFFLSTLNYDLP